MGVLVSSLGHCGGGCPALSWLAAWSGCCARRGESDGRGVKGDILSNFCDSCFFCIARAGCGGCKACVLPGALFDEAIGEG
jgi:hypothetical protein